MSIIRNLQQLQSPILDKNLDGCGTCIDSVFNKLFQCMHRGNNDFARGDLVDDIRVEGLEAW